MRYFEILEAGRPSIHIDMDKAFEIFKRVKSLKSTAKEMGYGYATFLARVKEYGSDEFKAACFGKRTSNFKPPLQIDLDKAYELYLQYPSLKTVGQKMGFANGNTLYRYIMKSDNEEFKNLILTQSTKHNDTEQVISKRNDGRRKHGHGFIRDFTEEQKQDIERFFKTGSTLTRLGKLYGVDRNTIKNMLLPRMGKDEFTKYAKLTMSSKLRKQYAVTGDIHRAGEIDNKKSKGPDSRNMRDQDLNIFHWKD